MNKLFPFLILLGLFLASCGEPATPNPAQVEMTMFADHVNANATQQKFDSIITITQQVVGATATQQAVWVQATSTQQARIDAQTTADRADANAQATALQARRDAQATQQRIDADATQLAVNALATQQRLDFEATQEQARRDLMATQQAEGTQMAWSVTNAVAPTHDYWTQQAVQQDILMATNDVELSNLKVIQQQHTNDLQWVLPALGYIVGLVALIYFVRNHFKVREIKNADGGVDGWIYDNKKYVAHHLLPKPVLELDSGEMPDVTDLKEQSDIVKRAQAVDALAVMPDHPSENAVGAFNDVFAGGAHTLDDVPFGVIDADEQPPAGLLDDTTLQTLRSDWKGAKSDE